MFKRTFLMVLTAAVVATSLTGCGGGKEQVPTTPPQLTREDQQAAVLAFQGQLVQKDSDALRMWKEFLKVFNSYTQRPGVIPATQAYDIAQSVQEACHLTFVAISTVPIPEGLPEDVAEALGQSRWKLSEAWALRESGVGDFAKSVDTLQPSYAVRARDKFEAAQASLEEAAQFLVTAKVLVGLEQQQGETSKPGSSS